MRSGRPHSRNGQQVIFTKPRGTSTVSPPLFRRGQNCLGEIQLRGENGIETVWDRPKIITHVLSAESHPREDLPRIGNCKLNTGGRFTESDAMTRILPEFTTTFKRIGVQCREES